MDGMRAWVLPHLLCVYMLLLISSGSSEQTRLRMYRQGRYSNATAHALRRQSIHTSLARYALKRIQSLRLRTGPIYNVSLSPSLQAITCQVMRLRTGSLHRRGLTFNNFHIPKGVQFAQTGGPFVFLVYKSIPLRSASLLYSLPPGYTFISPIVGIFIYTSSTSTSFNESFSETNLFYPPLPSSPISISIPIDRPRSVARHLTFTPLCAFFDINGTLFFSDLFSPPNICSASALLDSALVLPPDAAKTPFSSSSPNSTSSSQSSKRDPTRPWKVALITVVASFSGLALVGVTVLLGMRMQDNCQMAKLLKETDHNHETLHTSVIGHTRAPTAASVRTQPTLETEGLRS